MKKIKLPKALKLKSQKVEKLDTGQIVLHHHQSIKLTQNYQAAECSYGVTITIGPDDSIKEGFRIIENLVEEPLKKKLIEHQKFLNNLAN